MRGTRGPDHASFHEVEFFGQAHRKVRARDRLHIVHAHADRHFLIADTRGTAYMEFIDGKWHRLYAHELRTTDTVAFGQETSVDARTAYRRSIMQLDIRRLSFGKLLRHDGCQALHSGIVAVERQSCGAAVADLHILHYFASDRHTAKIDACSAKFKTRREHIQSASAGFRRNRISVPVAEFDSGNKTEPPGIVAKRHLERQQIPIARRYCRERGIEENYHIFAAVHIGRDAMGGCAVADERRAPFHRLYALGKRHTYFGSRHIRSIGRECYGDRRLLPRCPLAGCHCHDIGRVDRREAHPQRQCRYQ